MSISVSIDFMQLKNAVAQCNAEEKMELLHLLEHETPPSRFRKFKNEVAKYNTAEKMELLRLLEHETFPNRFKQFLEKVKTDELSLDDITAEVEAVRQSRHDARRN